MRCDNHNQKGEYMQAFNNNKLRGRIVELYGNQKEFSEKSGIPTDIISMKLNNKNRFTREDIEIWAEWLSIEPNDYHSYFFAH